MLMRCDIILNIKNGVDVVYLEAHNECIRHASSVDCVAFIMSLKTCQMELVYIVI